MDREQKLTETFSLERYTSKPSGVMFNKKIAKKVDSIKYRQTRLPFDADH